MEKTIFRQAAKPGRRSSRVPVTPKVRSAEESYPLLVHSHLRWDWVWQRPQQYLSRFSKRHPILFVEEPLPKEGLQTPRPALRQVADFPNITVLQPEFPPEMLRKRATVDEELKRLVKSVLAEPLGK